MVAWPSGRTLHGMGMAWSWCTGTLEVAVEVEVARAQNIRRLSTQRANASPRYQACVSICRSRGSEGRFARARAGGGVLGADVLRPFYNRPLPVCVKIPFFQSISAPVPFGISRDATQAQAPKKRVEVVRAFYRKHAPDKLDGTEPSRDPHTLVTAVCTVPVPRVSYTWA